MDPRRPPRTVSDPKVRQVGFVTPAAPPPVRSLSETPAAATSPSSGELALPGSSLSPVMIPPSRHGSSDGPPSRLSAPLAVPNPTSSLRRDSLQIPVGSYNPSEVVLGSPPTMSPSSRIDDVGSEFSDETSMSPRHGRSGSAKVATSFPGTSGEMMVMKTGGGSSTPKSPLTTASVVKTLPGISEKGGALMGTQNDGAGGSKKLKEKTTKAERRALQEAQRAAKAAAKEAGSGVKVSAAAGSAVSANTKLGKVAPQRKDVPQVAIPSGSSEKKAVDRPLEKDRKKDVPPPRMQFDDTHRVEKAKRRAIVNQFEAKNRVELFRHLPQYVHGTQLPDLEMKFFQLDAVHPSVYKVGLHYLSGNISGGNDRCIAMLLAFREAIKDYSTPPQKALVRDLTAKISSYVSFLIECRPLSISMGNAIKILKNRIAKLPHTISESEAKSSL